MALSEDSRPFTVLQQSSEDFKAAFNEDIQQCLKELNAKITTLMCDPDSVGDTLDISKGQNVHKEFSKAKYEIFVSMQTLLDELESDWLQQIADMKKNFLENVEIFLAGTKLEVKLPPSKNISRRLVGSARKQTSKEDYFSSPKVSSIYPALMNTAKHIPVLNNLLPDFEGDEMNKASPPKPSGKTPKKVTIMTTPTFEAPPPTTAFEEYYEESEDGEEPVIVTPAKLPAGRGRKSLAKTPISLIKRQKDSVIPLEKQEEEVQTPVKRSARGKRSTASTPVSTTKNQTETPVRGRNASKIDDEVLEDHRITVKSSRTPNRKSAGKGVLSQSVVHEDEMETSDSDTDSKKDSDGSNGQVHFSVSLDPMDDLEVYTPVVEVPRSTSRRKTMVTQVRDNFSDINLTPGAVRCKAKRKTIAFIADDLPVAPSPKRLKRGGGRNSMATSVSTMEVYEPVDPNPLDVGASDEGQYSPWIPLSDVSGKVSTQPGVYQLKVQQAKKPAYIGSCDSLRQKLTLHKLMHNTGHKHLDKFIERNKPENVQVRYEPFSSLSEAQSEEKNRINAFVARFKTTPSYN